MFKLIIGNRAYSSWSMRGWLACMQSDDEFEELVVPMFDAEWDKRREGDEFAPSLGKVPILWDGDCVVWDSLAIIEFLADRAGRECLGQLGRGGHNSLPRLPTSPGGGLWRRERFGLAAAGPIYKGTVRPVSKEF